MVPEKRAQKFVSRSFSIERLPNREVSQECVRWNRRDGWSGDRVIIHGEDDTWKRIILCHCDVCQDDQFENKFADQTKIESHALGGMTIGLIILQSISELVTAKPVFDTNEF